MAQAQRLGPPRSGSLLVSLNLCARRWVRAFKAAGLSCVGPSYLVDWVAHPWTPLAPQHRLFGTEAGAAVAKLEAARSKGGGSRGAASEEEEEEAQSMSF